MRQLLSQHVLIDHALQWMRWKFLAETLYTVKAVINQMPEGERGQKYIPRTDGIFPGQMVYSLDRVWKTLGFSEEWL